MKSTPAACLRMNDIHIEARLARFLEALPAADPSALCSPPGLGSLWRVRAIRAGLQQKVLVVHRSGKGLAFAPSPSSHRAKECRCGHCLWEYTASEPNSPPVSRERVIALARRLQTLQMGQSAEVSLDG